MLSELLSVVDSVLSSLFGMSEMLATKRLVLMLLRVGCPLATTFEGAYASASCDKCYATIVTDCTVAR